MTLRWSKPDSNFRSHPLTRSRSLGGLVRLAARDKTDAAVAKPEMPFVRIDELGADLRDVVGGAIECAARHDLVAWISQWTQ